MDTPGIDIRPLETMEGTTEFCEVFFDDVRVPVANRVGDENDGWRVANVTLSFERGTAFVSDVLRDAGARARPRRARRRRSPATAPPAGRTPGLRRDLGDIAAELDALWALTKRNISQAQRTGLVGVGGSVFKLAFTELRHRLGDVAMHLLDRASLSLDDIGDLRAASTCTAASGRLSMTHRRGHVAGAAQHRRRARARPAPGSLGRRVDFELTDDQVALQEGDARVPRRPLPARRRPRASRRAGHLDRDRGASWARPACSRCALPEADGGLELGVSEAALVFEELGRGARARSARRHLPRRRVDRRRRDRRDDRRSASSRARRCRCSSTPPTSTCCSCSTDDGVRRLDPAAFTTRAVERPLDALHAARDRRR